MAINLMPWRAERRKRLQKDFLTKLGLSALAALLLVVVLAVMLSATIAGQNKRNDYLADKIKVAENDIASISELEKKKNALLSRKQVIENLQADRDQLAHLFYELASNSVDGVVINSIEEKSKVLEIRGKAISNPAVAAYMHKIELSPWVDKPEIVIIQNADETAGKSKFNVNLSANRAQLLHRYAYTFVIHTGFKNPNAPAVEDDTVGGAKPAKDKKRNRHDK